MKRFALLTAAAAMLCCGLTQTSQAQFRINLGNGIQFDSKRGVQFNPGGGHKTLPYPDKGGGHKTLPYPGKGGHHGGGHKTLPHPGNGHHDHYHDAHHVVRFSSDRFRGGYYERGGKCYYEDGRGHVTQVRYGSFSHVDDLALRLEWLTKELCLDMHYNYRHNRGFRETYREVYELYELAKYIHEEEHHGHRSEIRRQLGGMDALFHHVQHDVRGWHRHHRRQVGTLGIIDKMDRIEATIHHLMNDVGVEEPPLPDAGSELPPLPR